MSRLSTWNNIGTEVSTANNVADVLSAANLDYEVEKVPVFLEDGTKVPNLCCTKKKDSDKIFGHVGSKYEIVQNMDAFNFVNDFIPEGMEFVKAGETSSIVYIIAKFPDRYVLDDEVTPYLIFQNSHSLASAVRFTITPLRIVCQNQFNWAFKNASNKVSIRHTITASDRLIQAKDELIEIDNYLNEFEYNAQLLAEKHVDPHQIVTITDYVFTPEDPTSDRSVKSAYEKQDRFMEAYSADDNINFRGTAWGLVNAYADYITHRPMMKDTETARANRFVETTLGSDMMSRFINVINNVAV